MHRDLDTVIVKVSVGNSPSLDPGNWRRYVMAYALAPDESIDFPTLGSDANGLYFSVQVIASPLTQRGYRIQAFKKPDVYTNVSYQPPPALIVQSAELDTWCIQPAFNFDGSPVGGYAWFIAKGPSSGNTGGRIYYRRLQWNGTTVAWAPGGWQVLGDPFPGYRDYYDIPQRIQNPVLLAPAKEASGLDLGWIGSKLLTSIIRNGYLWTCHHVGSDGSDGAYHGSTVNRSAVQWFKLQVAAGTLTYSAHGRIYDSASSNPYWYHFPSLNVNAAGDIVLGFSGSRTTEYIGAFWHMRKANGSWVARPALIQAGRAAYINDRWGDYSATTIDPNDGSFWTVQEHANAPQGPNWSTWISQIRIAP
jgi:hypothetical protein